MRKWVCVLLLPLLLFCSCKSRSPSFYPLRVSKAGFTLIADGDERTGTLQLLAMNDLRFTFSGENAPDAVLCKADETGLTVFAGEIEDRIGYDELPDDAPMKLLPAIIRQAVFENVPFTKTAEGFETSGSFQSVGWTAVFREDGTLLKIFDDAGIMTVTFTEKEDENDRSTGESPH